MSARQIALLADAPVSSIYHHFGSLEHLFSVSQEECLAAAETWCNRQVEQIADFGGSPESWGSYFALVVDEWSYMQRPLAFAWRECQLLAHRRPNFVNLAERWHSLWQSFWERVGAQFELGSRTSAVERIFDNESLLHMLCWRRSIDRAALEERGRGLAAWLSGEPAPATPWRDFAQAQALLLMPATPSGDEITERIRQAAAHLIENAGVAGVTHRAVAGQAGLTLSTVAYKFRTKSALLKAAFDGVSVALNAQTDERAKHGTPASLSTLADDVIQAVERTNRVSLGNALYVAVARDADLNAFGAQLRYLRGRASLALLPP
ncbi:TetR/AcrR family transcriptional regulator [Novosphingobium sp. HII-3]|uniref:TetR/AcrR family transcriptional regulator n=1 Tax=Novosphingobium sp. HII-3 TaxID=2075565 RepID=UPI000CDA933A|nr:TetR family transcriptional regulator [Novosphingobium sp. HII-3]